MEIFPAGDRSFTEAGMELNAPYRQPDQSVIFAETLATCKREMRAGIRRIAGAGAGDDHLALLPEPALSVSLMHSLGRCDSELYGPPILPRRCS
jgi:hypothetical protein